MRNWYVFGCLAGTENKICLQINSTESKRIGSAFVPLVEYLFKRSNETRREIKPMFPGYIFMESNKIDSICKTIDKMGITCKVLKNGENITPLPQHEVDSLLMFSDEDYIVNASEAVKENEKVRITKGPLMGREGLIRKIDRHKRIAIAEFELMGELRRVTLGLEVI